MHQQARQGRFFRLEAEEHTGNRGLDLVDQGGVGVRVVEDCPLSAILGLPLGKISEAAPRVGVVQQPQRLLISVATPALRAEQLLLGSGRARLILHDVRLLLALPLVAPRCLDDTKPADLPIDEVPAHSATGDAEVDLPMATAGMELKFRHAPSDVLADLLGLPGGDVSPQAAHTDLYPGRRRCQRRHRALSIRGRRRRRAAAVVR
mmetsp:Transcript_148042/g.369027  ORF Transcript_148042/g.369027 Transcript_148042/m.369027 type:complete len:206 (-) Transcript_148042:163-780(-)